MKTPFTSIESIERKQIRKNTRDIIKTLAVIIGERHLVQYESLNDTKEFIKDYFLNNGQAPVEESYRVEGKVVANLIVEKKGTMYPDEIILIGGHYDTVEGSPGADDNSTAIAALLELHRLLYPHQFKRTVRFVAFTLEEPPHFGSKFMGSMHHAAGCRKRNEKIKLMICLDMLGYASRKYTQNYPIEEMKEKLPSHGDFLGVFSLPSSSEYVYFWKKIYNSFTKKKIHEFIGPASIPGMDLSDHTSFIKNGYPAIMISDTAFYRNNNYHSGDDTFDTINFKFLTENIYTSYLTLTDILNREKLIG